MDKQKIASAFNEAAFRYDQHAQIQQLVAARLYRLIAYHQRINHQSFINICDLGCGTGFLTERLCKNFPTSSVLATDIAPNMLKLCSAKLKHYPNLETSIFDAETSQFPQVFDLIASNLALQWVNNLHTTLERIWQSTNRLLCFSTLCEGTFIEWQNLFTNLNLPDAIISLYKFDALQSILQKLKPKTVFIKRQRITQDFIDPLAFLKHLKAIGAHYSPYTNSAALFTRVKVLRSIIKRFNSQKGFTLSYEIAYCFLNK